MNFSPSGQVKDNINGWVARIGDWELFDKDYYRSKKGVVQHGQTIPYDNPTVNSIKPISKPSVKVPPSQFLKLTPA